MVRHGCMTWDQTGEGQLQNSLGIPKVWPIQALHVSINIRSLFGLTLELWDSGTLKLGRVTEDWSESMEAVLGKSEILQRNQVNFKHLYSTPSLTAFGKNLEAPNLDSKLKPYIFLIVFQTVWCSSGKAARTHSSDILGNPYFCAGGLDRFLCVWKIGAGG